MMSGWRSAAARRRSQSGGLPGSVSAAVGSLASLQKASPLPGVCNTRISALWIEDALSPLDERMPERELRRLIYGIGATLGIEALVWLTDVGELSREEAVEVMRSNARALLRSAFERLK